ncbi:probable Golgi SNAP receptor complex member 2 [Teleopsis dalmanni]|uniref:probable Golgi SNAP receptor complex member 2 n=1 Tax=Teleopsis dalmanni TaxID=139649 RepID=UPI0018CEAB44|nr:probable Golgi SNAP receptor complex member 2 [Teleopsis dalmanni]
MEALYHQTNRVLQEIEKNFQKLNSQESFEVENDIQTQITTVKTNCDRLDVLLYKVPVSQRPSAKMRVDQLKYDVRHLENSLQLYREKRQRKLNEMSEREQLLSHRFTANSTEGAPETCLDMDHALQHHSQLGNAHQGVDEMIATGGNILGSLINQRETLKGAQRRILAIGSTLGLSNHTMKLIERRFSEDKYIMLVGMAITLLVIGFVIYFIVF